MFVLNKGIKIVIAVIVSAWVFFMGYEIGTYRETKKIASQTTAASVVYQPPQASTTAAPPQAPTAPTQPDTTNPSVSADATTDVADTSAPVTSATELSGLDILAKVTQAVNAAKNYKGAFTASTTQIRQLGITDCSVESLTNTIDRIVQQFVGGGRSDTYSFVNGYGTSKEGLTVTPNDVIPPRKTPFTLIPEGMSAATAKKDGENDVYTINLISESASLDALPANNSAAAGYLDLSSLSILTSIEYSYPATVIEATVAPNGMLSALHVYMPISAKGAGTVIGFEGYASFSGSLDETWSFIYT